MEEVVGLVTMGALVGFALVKAYANKVLTQLRTEATRLIASERHVRQQMDLEESQLESSEARLSKVEHDKAQLATKLEDVARQREQVDGELSRLKIDQEEGSEDSPTA
ncbi:MAG: hypothetical protein O2782_21950 [bacterium]|nr:hypothetical protein [bacterium]